MSDIKTAVKLNEIIDRSYSPYSNFKVAAKIETDDGSEFYGVNVENASYSMTLCAETSAIASMIAEKGLAKISKVYISNSSNKICPPCGACRQRIAEFATAETIVTMFNCDHSKIVSKKFSQLLPLQFDSEIL